MKDLAQPVIGSKRISAIQNRRDVLFERAPMTLLFALLRKNCFEVQFASATDKIDFMGSDVTSPLEDLPKDEECQNDGSGEICFEEGGGIGCTADGEQSDVELSDKTEDVEDKTDP